MFKNLYPIILTALSATLCSAQSIQHVARLSVKSDEALVISAGITELGDAGVAQFIVNYRPSGQTLYQSLPLAAQPDGLYTVEIPPLPGGTRTFEYYLDLQMVNGMHISWPEIEPELHPAHLTVDGPDTNSTPPDNPAFAVLPLEPAPGSRISADDALLYLSYFGLEAVDTGAIRVLLNGKDITSQVDIRSNHLLFQPRKLEPGLQTVSVVLPKTDGTKRQPVNWSFVVEAPAPYLPGAASPRKTGKISADHINSSVDDESLSVSNLYLDHKFERGILKLDTRIRLTSLEDKTLQPRNRYRFKLKLPWFQADFGDIHPVLNTYGLNGNRVRGLQLSTHYKSLRLDLVKGALMRVVQHSDVNGSMSIPVNRLQTGLANEDTLNITLSRDKYTFKRDLFAFNLGLGSKRHVHWNLNIIKAKDDVGSVHSTVQNSLITLPSELSDQLQPGSEAWVLLDTSEGDTSYTVRYCDLVTHKDDIFGTDRIVTLSPLATDWQGVKPQDNIILGSDLSLQLHKRRIQFRTGFSFSMLNRDIWEPVLTEQQLQDQVDSTLTLPFDPSNFETIFHMGLNQTPLLPVDAASDANVFTLITHMPSMAYNLTLNLNYFRQQFQFRYRQIGPEFNSLANPYLPNNLRERIFSDRMRFMANRLMMTVKYFSTDDAINLATLNTTKTHGGSVNLSYYPAVDLPLISLRYRVENRKAGDASNIYVDANQDTLGASNQENSRNNSLLFTLVHHFNYHGRQQLSFNYARSDKKDLLETSLASNSDYFSPEMHSQNLSLQLSSVFNELWNSAFSYNYAYYNYGKGLLYSSQSINEMKLIFEYKLNRWETTVRSGVSLSNGNGPAVFDQSSAILGADWQIRPDVKLMADWEYRRKLLPDSHHFQNYYFKTRIAYDF